MNKIFLILKRFKYLLTVKINTCLKLKCVCTLYIVQYNNNIISALREDEHSIFAITKKNIFTFFCHFDSTVYHIRIILRHLNYKNHNQWNFRFDILVFLL